MSALAIAGGIAAGLGTAFGNVGSSIYSTERNIANSNYQAELSRNFEREMASTQYQRAVKDMEAAGLNPAAIGADLSSNAAPNAAAATGNYGHIAAPDFSNIFNSAVSAAIAKDKNLSDRVLQELKDESALQVQRLRNQGHIENEVQKKALGHSAYNSMELEDKKTENRQMTEYWKQVHGHRNYK